MLWYRPVIRNLDTYHREILVNVELEHLGEFYGGFSEYCRILAVTPAGTTRNYIGTGPGLTQYTAE